jgi:RNA polymerase sigma-70 factor (ECF subfamily)
MDDRTQVFEQHRARLSGVAYRMLGSRADAEDIVQDAYLRWHRASVEEIRSPEAWLVTTVTRLCIDRLRQARVERDAYVGPWLPEPLVRSEAPPADAPTELASNLSVAFLVVLERLAPDERAAFLLHEVFDSSYDEIAQILGKSEAACRQIVSRARKRVRDDRPRVEVSAEARRNLLGRFAQAVIDGDKEALLGMLAKDATWTADGGGKAKAAHKVVRGADHVARFVLGVLSRYSTLLEFRDITVNEESGLAIYHGEQLISVLSIKTDGARILDVFSVLNPDKLQHVSQGDSFVRLVHEDTANRKDLS